MCGESELLDPHTVKMMAMFSLCVYRESTAEKCSACPTSQIQFFTGQTSELWFGNKVGLRTFQHCLVYVEKNIHPSLSTPTMDKIAEKIGLSIALGVTQSTKEQVWIKNQWDCSKKPTNFPKKTWHFTNITKGICGESLPIFIWFYFYFIQLLFPF